MDPTEECPLFAHDLDAPAAFRPEDLVAAVRLARGLPDLAVPAICVLDFDGDLTDWLVDRGKATLFEPWSCFHTRMYVVDTEGARCGIVARTIGGPYAVLIAEQLRVSGAQLILGLTSAGRVAPALPLPSLVVATSAVRDEGVSLHYLPAGRRIACPSPVTKALTRELSLLRWSVSEGPVWTTDAPYRETAEQLRRHAAAGVLAVEMQAASLFAFAAARGIGAGVVAQVSNAVDYQGEPFDKGSDEDSFLILRAMVRAGSSLLQQARA